MGCRRRLPVASWESGQTAGLTREESEATKRGRFGGRGVEGGAGCAEPGEGRSFCLLAGRLVGSALPGGGGEVPVAETNKITQKTIA